MKKLILITFLFIQMSFISYSQEVKKEDFGNYAEQQNKLMVATYEKKDVPGYLQLLDGFVKQYNAQTEELKQTYLSYFYNAYYNLACTYSLLKDKKNALIYLGKSIKAGFDNKDHIDTDSDLDFIRKEPKFIKLLKPIKSKLEKYLSILKSDHTFKNAKNEILPKFSYQSSEDNNLVQLKKTYNLDSIAGSGNDISKIINLMRWIHNRVKHDGNKLNPEIMNASNFLKVCFSDGKTLNCRGLAIALNEIYLSLGFKSRYVTCWPKDTSDFDCHVINMVFVKSLNKWIWIDPTFEAYVMDENGNLLGLEEVRERLIMNKPLILNPDANWNHISSQTKKDYLYTYMAKNLYRLECSVKSEYNYETKEKDKIREFIQLTPVEYNIYVEKFKANNKGNSSLVKYYTNDPKVFWTEQ